MKNTKMAKYDDIDETSKSIPDLEFCRKEPKQTLDNIKVGVSLKNKCSAPSREVFFSPLYFHFITYTLHFCNYLITL